MEYRVRVIAYSSSAKSKGLVTGRWTARTEKEDRQRGWDAENITVEARDHQEAFSKVSAQFRPNDKRPVSGASYIRHAALKPLKVGDKVRVVEPYAFNPETEQGYIHGTVTEVVSDRIVSVGFPGYHTQFVDFNLSELVKE